MAVFNSSSWRLGSPHIFIVEGSRGPGNEIENGHKSPTPKECMIAAWLVQLAETLALFLGVISVRTSLVGQSVGLPSLTVPQAYAILCGAHCTLEPCQASTAHAACGCAELDHVYRPQSPSQVPPSSQRIPQHALAIPQRPSAPIKQRSGSLASPRAPLTPQNSTASSSPKPYEAPEWTRGLGSHRWTSPTPQGGSPLPRWSSPLRANCQVCQAMARKGAAPQEAPPSAAAASADLHLHSSPAPLCPQHAAGSRPPSAARQPAQGPGSDSATGGTACPAAASNEPSQAEPPGLPGTQQPAHAQASASGCHQPWSSGAGSAASPSRPASPCRATQPSADQAHPAQSASAPAGEGSQPPLASPFSDIQQQQQQESPCSTSACQQQQQSGASQHADAEPVRVPAVPVHAAFASGDAARPGDESYSLLLNPSGARYTQAALNVLHVAPVTSFNLATRQLR